MNPGRVTVGGILAGEWIKLASLRSTWWVTAMILPVTLLIAAVFALSMDQAFLGQVQDAAGLGVVAQVAGGGILFAQLIVIVLGTLTITSEYGTGSIRTSCAAVPNRAALVLGKAAVVGLWTGLVGVLTAGVAWAVCLPLLVGRGLSVSWSDPAALLWSVLGTGGVLAMTAVFALGVGAVVRSSAGGLSTSAGVLFVLTVIVQILASVTGAESVNRLMSFLLSPASNGAVGLDNGELAGWQSLLVVLGWAAVSLLVGALVARRRDV